MPPKQRKKKTPKGWEHSDAKAELYAAIINGDVPLVSTNPEYKRKRNGELSGVQKAESNDVLTGYFDSLPKVKAFGEFRLFEGRLTDLRAQIGSDLSPAQEDQVAFDKYVSLHPKALVAAKGGYPEWEGSEAQKSLKMDMENNAHEAMRPMALWETRAEYQLFPLQVFRDHIYQEIRTGKFVNQLKLTGKGHKWKELFKEMQDKNNN